MFIVRKTYVVNNKNHFFSEFCVGILGASIMFFGCSSTEATTSAENIASATPVASVTVTPIAATPVAAAPVVAAPVVATPVVATPVVAAPSPIPEIPTTSFAKIQESILLKKDEIILNSIDKNALTEVIKGEFENQSALLPYYANANSEKFGIVQRRFSNNSDFDIYARDNMGDGFYSLFQNNNFIFDAVSVCNLSKEVIYLSPGIDASGKAFKNKKPRRISIFSAINGEKNLIWRMGSHDRGFIGHAISATPDCKHLIINLHLETDKTRIPYGQLIYVKNEPNKWNELPATILAEIKPNGQLKNFSSAVFVMPQNPAFYKPSKTPPPVIAIQQNIDASVGRAFIFNPNTKGNNWKRDVIELPKSVRRMGAPVFYNKLDYAFVLFDKQEQDANEVYKTAVGLLSLQNGNPIITEIIDTVPYKVSYMHVHPSGNRMALSFVLSPEDKIKNPHAGVLEFTFNSKNGHNISLIEEVPSFNTLSMEHNPRASYTPEGNYLLYNSPVISFDADASIFGIAARVDSKLQFPTKLMQLLIK